MRRVTLYREDSVSQVVYERVKHAFWTVDGSVLVLAIVRDDGSHYYVNWLREKIAWYKEESL